VCCRDLCVGPITRPEESYRVWFVCDREVSTMTAHKGLSCRGEGTAGQKLDQKQVNPGVTLSLHSIQGHRGCQTAPLTPITQQVCSFYKRTQHRNHVTLFESHLAISIQTRTYLMKQYVDW